MIILHNELGKEYKDVTTHVSSHSYPALGHVEETATGMSHCFKILTPAASGFTAFSNTLVITEFWFDQVFVFFLLSFS